jgi:hypothetical protein
MRVTAIITTVEDKRWTEGRISSCDIEPGEKFIRRLLKFVFMILAFVVAIVFDEFSFGMCWRGAVISVIGPSMDALAIDLLKDLRNRGKPYRLTNEKSSNLHPPGQCA